MDENQVPIEGNSGIIDEFAEKYGVAATIFKRDGNDFTRIVTSIKKENGQRAVGTKLGTGSAAYEPVMNRTLFLGEAVILGVNYVTAYNPVINEKNEIIGIYFVGIPMNEVETGLSLTQRR